MFSAITIASSTKIPITIIIPKVDNTLIVSPKIGANINIPKKETGRPKATQKAILEFKKIERNSSTKSIPWNIFFANSSVRSVRVMEASFKTSNFIFSLV